MLSVPRQREVHDAMGTIFGRPETGDRRELDSTLSAQRPRKKRGASQNALKPGDDRLIYPPGDDYDSQTSAEHSTWALKRISHDRKLVGVPASYDPADWQQWWARSKSDFGAPGQ